MTRAGLAVILATTLLPPTIDARHGGSVDPVVVDVVATDGRGAPVEGLTAADFRVREDGLPVPIDSIREVGGGGRSAPRTAMILLDDTATRPQLTTVVQQIARRVVTRAAPGDHVTVVRLNRRGDDEGAGGEAIALARINDYTAGMTPFFGRETIENVLGKVTRFARAFTRDGDEPQRRTLLAIGSPAVFDVREPFERRASLIWEEWVEALAASSRALVNVSVIDPAGVTGRVKLIGALGLVERTGGESHYNSAAFDAAVDDVWRHAGHYYLLEYTPRPGDRELHELEVAATRAGVHITARRVRG